MKLTFRNTTANDVLLILMNNNYTLSPSSEMSFETDTSNVEFSLEPRCASEIRYLSRKTGVISLRSFKLKASYTVKITKDTLIQLVSNVKKGKFRDEYERIVPFSNDCSFSNPFYCVRDEKAVRYQFEKSRTKGNRTLLIFDFFDILGNCLTALLLLIVPFALIWIFGDFDLAVRICGYAFIPIFIIILLINRLFDKFKRKIWKKGKSFALKNQIFKDYNSYFDNEYITSVFNAE